MFHSTCHFEKSALNDTKMALDTATVTGTLPDTQYSQAVAPRTFGESPETFALFHSTIR